jgi:serine/threonine protein kinase
VEASRQGDVYSYGILVLEMFTGRRPTDEIFKDGLNLHNFVKMALPAGRLVQIVDPSLLITIVGETANEEKYMKGGYNKEIEEEESINYENLSKMNTHVWQCIHTILKLGLACSEESPKNRTCMEDVVRDLHHLQNAFNSVEIS